MKHRPQNTEHRVQNTNHRTRNTEHKTENWDHKKLEIKFGHSCKFDKISRKYKVTAEGKRPETQTEKRKTMSEVMFVNLTSKIVRIVSDADRITVIREIKPIGHILEVSLTSPVRMILDGVPVFRPGEKRIADLPAAEPNKGYKYFVIPRAMKSFVPFGRTDVLCPGVNDCFLEDGRTITCSFLEAV